MLYNYVSAKFSGFRDELVKTLAKWDPETVGEAQLLEWEESAKKLAATAVKATNEANAASAALSTARSDIARYTAAATKLAPSNPEAANKAADQALEIDSKLQSLIDDAEDATAWAHEAREAAERAQKAVLEGRRQIDAAKREQARAAEQERVAEARCEDRERVAGLTRSLTGSDAAINAMKANAQKSRDAAAANNLRSSVIGKSAETDDAIKTALAEVDGSSSTMSLADKLARLNK